MRRDRNSVSCSLAGPATHRRDSVIDQGPLFVEGGLLILFFPLVQAPTREFLSFAIHKLSSSKVEMRIGVSKALLEIVTIAWL